MILSFRTLSADRQVRNEEKSDFFEISRHSCFRSVDMTHLRGDHFRYRNKKTRLLKADLLNLKKEQ